MTTRAADQLRALGVRRRGTLLVHSSFRQLRPVFGSPDAVIEVLMEAVGRDGTLVMPSMSDDDDHPFDPANTPCLGMGVVADTFWRLPGVQRSDSPHAFAAVGPSAALVTAPHPIDVPHGHDSPVGRVYDLDGQVLLLGVVHDSNTTIHLAENMAGVRYRRPKYATVLRDGKPERVYYGEVDHCTERFSLVGRWLTQAGLQNAGIVGRAKARFMNSRDVVRVAMARLAENETVLLHPYGVDSQCDEARASIPPERLSEGLQ